MTQACAAGGGSSKPVSSAAVEKCEEKRKPEAFFGHRKADQIPPSAPWKKPLLSVKTREVSFMIMTRISAIHPVSS